MYDDTPKKIDASLKSSHEKELINKGRIALQQPQKPTDINAKQLPVTPADAKIELKPENETPNENQRYTYEIARYMQLELKMPAVQSQAP